MEPRDRLRALRKQRGLTQAALSSILGVVPITITRWERGDRQLDRMALIALGAVFGVSVQWLERGEGPSVAPSTEHPDAPDLIDCPVLSGTPSCGPCGEIHDPGPDATRFPLRRTFADELIRDCGAGSPATLYFARCQGDSMRPTIHDGDMALINTAEPLRMRPVRDAIYLVRLDPASCDARIKRVQIHEASQELQLLSDAPGFRPLRVPLEGIPLQQLILGRVCWIGRNVLADEGPNNW